MSGHIKNKRTPCTNTVSMKHVAREFETNTTHEKFLPEKHHPTNKIDHRTNFTPQAWHRKCLLAVLNYKQTPVDVKLLFYQLTVACKHSIAARNMRAQTHIRAIFENRGCEPIRNSGRMGFCRKYLSPPLIDCLENLERFAVCPNENQPYYPTNKHMLADEHTHINKTNSLCV